MATKPTHFLNPYPPRTHTPPGKVPLSRTGDIVWSRTSKTNSELFTLTYGVLVAQLLRDFEGVEEVNRELRRMGRNIGVRLIDEVRELRGRD